MVAPEPAPGVWPDGVPVVRVQWSRGYVATGNRADVQMVIEAVMPGAESLVHQLTGAKLTPLPVKLNANTDDENFIDLPAVDADHWIDQNGTLYKGWSYLATLRYLSNNKSTTITRTFQLLEGDPPVDMDLIESGTPGAPVLMLALPVRTVNGLRPDATGNVQLATGDGAVDAAAILAPHVASSHPHPAYDHIPSLKLLFQNGLI
jgi:hypothetical protein